MFDTEGKQFKSIISKNVLKSINIPTFMIKNVGLYRVI